LKTARDFFSGSPIAEFTKTDTAGIVFSQKFGETKMNDPAESGRRFRQGFLFKSRNKLQGIKPTGGGKNNQNDRENRGD